MFNYMATIYYGVTEFARIPDSNFIVESDLHLNESIKVS